MSVCTEGIYAPAPPCSPYCESACSCCCFRVGQIGFRMLDKKSIRAPFFITLGAFSVIQLVMGIAAAFSLSKETSTVKNLFWSRVNFDGAGDIYAGLTTVVVDYEHGNVTYKATDSWDDFCEVSEMLDGKPAAEKCSKCQESSASFHVAAVAGALSKLGQLGTDFTRSRQKEDVNCQKILGVVSGIVGGIATIFALQQYSDVCFNNLPEELISPQTGETIGVEVTAGAGFILTLLITIGAFIDGFAHILVPCPEDAAEPGYLEARAKGAEGDATMSI